MENEIDVKLCRREVERPSGAVGPHNATITKKNALNWCESCRARLPLWPADDVREVLVLR